MIIIIIIMFIIIILICMIRILIIMIIIRIRIVMIIITLASRCLLSGLLCFVVLPCLFACVLCHSVCVCCSVLRPGDVCLGGIRGVATLRLIPLSWARPLRFETMSCDIAAVFRTGMLVESKPLTNLVTVS